MEKTRVRGHIEILFPVILFLVFTLSALFIILFAARTYQHIVEESSQVYDKSTSMAYLSQKLHSRDESGSISVGNIDNSIPAIILSETIDDSEYVTYIYVYDGYLRELFTSANASGVSPAAGTKLFEAESFYPEFINKDLLALSLSIKGEESMTQLVTVRSMR